MTSVFLSYSRKDSTIAQKLMKEFRAIGLDVWVDWEDIPPAVGWLDQILQGIEQADVFVFLVSPDSIKSEVCNVEIEHAHKNAKRIIPILVRDVLAKDAVSIIRDLNWILIREQDDFATGLQKVQVAVNIDVDWLQEHRRLQVRALDWDRRKDPSLLLRGGDLRNAARMLGTHEKSDPKPSDLQKMYILFSRRSERVRTFTIISAALALVVMVLLSALAFDQRRAALANAEEAQKQTILAQQSESLAIENARVALARQAIADKNAQIAQAQRSAARAQIYQSRTGGLFTSTLLAIDSYKRNPSNEAEGILRTNISLLPILVKETQQEGQILAIEVSPDQESFAYTSEDGTACLIRFEDGEAKFCVTSSGSVLDAAFSPDGSLLVTSDSVGEVKVLSVEDGQQLHQEKFGVPVRDVNISPDGRLLAMARDDGRITLIKLSDYEFSGEFSVYGELRVTAFSPDGLWFAAGSDIGSITFWNIATGRIISSAAHRGEVFDIAFSPDSRRLISGGADNFAVTTSPSTGRELLRVINEEWVADVEYSPDGAWFVTASNDFRIRVWDTDSGEERLRFLQDSLVSEVKVSPNGLWIASTGSDRTVRVWSAVNGAEMFQIPLGDAGTDLEFSMDSAYLITGDTGGSVSIWNISVLNTNAGYLRFDDFIGNLEAGPNGDWYAASTGGKVWLLTPELFATQTALQTSPAVDLGKDTVYDLKVNPDGTLIVISTIEGRVTLLNRLSGTTQNLISTGPAKKVAFSPDGTILFFASQDGVVQFRNLSSNEAGIFWQRSSAIYAIDISKNNQIALGMDDKITLLDMNSGQATSALNAPGKNQLVAFNAAGTMLVSSTSSGRTFIWHEEAGDFEQKAEHVGNVASVLSFTPSGDRLFIGETDQILVFDPMEGKEVSRIRQKGDIADIAFSPDDATMLAGSLRAVQFFDMQFLKEVSGEEIVTVACSHLIENFSPAEWLSFFGEEEEYQVLCEALPVP